MYLSTKLNNFLEFDEITRFRLINAFLFGIGFNLILPILLDLRGELLSSTFITFILIVTTLSVKTNIYLVKLQKENLYKLGIFAHLIFLLGALTYYYDKLLFVYVDSFIGIIEVAIFSAYSIKLDVYLTNNYPKDVKKFQVFKNSNYADATLIGLFIVWITSYIGGNDYSVLAFVIFNIGFTAWMFYNWNFFKEANDNYLSKV